MRQKLTNWRAGSGQDSLFAFLEKMIAEGCTIAQVIPTDYQLHTYANMCSALIIYTEKPVSTMDKVSVYVEGGQ